jgi:hypothetical protein
VSENIDFDMQAAWLRRFNTDAETNLKAFALRLKEALPELVTIHESRGLFSRSVKTKGITVELGENRYSLEVDGGRLKAKIAMVVHGVVLNTKTVDPSDWFGRLSAETRKASEHAGALSRSLGEFMAG